MRKKWTPIIDLKAREAKSQGMLGKEIGKILGFSEATVCKKLAKEPKELFAIDEAELSYSKFCQGREIQLAGGSFHDIANTLRITLQKAVQIFKPFDQRPKYFWTAEREAELMHWTDNGYGVKAIANHLGTGTTSVSKKQHELYSLLAKYEKVTIDYSIN